MSEDSELHLKHIAADLQILKGLVGKVVHYMVEAESEVPEKMRRFIMYMHDIHDIKNLYDEHGLPVPDHVMREVERCDDRLRQLLLDLHTDGNAFERIRAEMAKDTENRWDHTRRLTPPKGNGI